MINRRKQRILSLLTRNLRFSGLKGLNEQFEKRFSTKPSEGQSVAAQLVGLAHLAHLDLDPRVAETAIKYLVLANAYDQLTEFNRLAKLRRHFRLAWLTGQELRLPNWQEEFRTWFKEDGVWWFDLFEDSDAGYSFMHPDDVALISSISQILDLDDQYWLEISQQAENRADVPMLRQRLVKLLAEKQEPMINEIEKKDNQPDYLF